ncbi:MAG: hypothetical protein MRJ65_12650 [Candidatus Brocadiaceae bacterium]|nr:hypothetical protein [Candidatus Brocadiaceae bacterium]
MKLPINKKIMKFAGIGLVVISIAVVVMRFMKKEEAPSKDQEVQEEVKEEGKEDADSSSSIGEPDKDSMEKEKDLKTGLPSAYKINVAKIFKPLSSHEIAKMLKELEKEKNEYERRKEHFDFKEKVLLTMQEDLEKERQELETLKQELSKFLDLVTIKKEELKQETIQIDEVESKNLKKLADVYSNMKPQKAAMIMREMDENMAVKLLTMMDKKTSAKILETIDPTLAVKFSKKLKLVQLDQ